MSLILIKNGTVGRADGSFRGDVLIEGGKIREVGPCIEHDGASVVDVDGRYVLPGGVDPKISNRSWLRNSRIISS